MAKLVSGPSRQSTTGIARLRRLTLAVFLLIAIVTRLIAAQEQDQQEQQLHYQRAVDDILFNIREARSPDNNLEPSPGVRTSTGSAPGGGSKRPSNPRPTRTSSSRPLTKQPMISAPAPNHPKLSTSKSATGLILTSPLLLQSVQMANLPPFVYATEGINQTHANMFSRWLDSKSSELFELSMNYSGFKLLNDTYYVHLSKDARPAWINFTEMIMNISNTISEVLSHKTLIVKNLTDLVEKAFDEYRNSPDRILESTKTVYYDAKSPKTFCDVQEANNARTAAAAAAKLNSTLSAAAASVMLKNATASNSSATSSESLSSSGSTLDSGGGSTATKASSSKVSLPFQSLLFFIEKN